MRPLLRNQLPVPAKDGVGSHERGHFGEGTAPNGLAADSKSSALSVGQSQSSATELLPENSVLLPKILAPNG